MTTQTRPNDRVWAQGFFLGLVPGFVSVWLGLVGISLLLALAAALSLSAWGRKRAAGALVGLGVGMAAILGYGASRCPAYLGIPADSCSAPDLRPVLMAAAGIAVIGLLLTYRHRPAS